MPTYSDDKFAIFHFQGDATVGIICWLCNIEKTQLSFEINFYELS